MPEYQVDAGLKVKPEVRPDYHDKEATAAEQKRIGLVIPCLNYFEGVVDLLSSVRTRHITTVYIQPQYREKVALAKAWNDGAKRAFNEGCDYALICNDDVIFAPETLDNFVSEFQRLNPEGVVLLSGSNIRGQLMTKWDILNFYNKDAVSTAEHPDFSCFMIDRNFFELMGTFDENFYPAWNEDLDMHQRIYLAGKKAMVSTACPINHLGSVTTALMIDKNSSASDNHFIEKWGSKNGHIPQKFEHPYNDPSKTWKDW